MTSDQSRWPAAFTERIRKQFPSSADLFLESLDQDPAISIRVNPAKFREEFLLEKIPWCNNGYFLKERPVFALDPLWHAGCYYVQEASSTFLEQVMKQIKADHPKLILDLCAAPGGKSTHLISLINDDELLVSNEVIRSRVPALIENMTKWGKTNYLISSSDARQFGKTGALFDLLVIDAPCSGEGLFRRDPGAAREWSVENTSLCAVRQRRILADSWPALKKGGYLIYSTCTFNPSENEENLSWLRSHGGFSSIRIPLDPNWQIEEILHENIWGYRFLPDKMEGEGFFISLLQKEEETAPVHFPKKFRTKLQKPRQLPENWILDPGSKKFFQHQDQIKFIPRNREKEILFLFDQINLVKAGTTFGHLKQRDTLPDHELAMSVNLNSPAFQQVETGLEGALDYLRRDQLSLHPDGKNWQLVTFRQIPLGFVKNIGHRYNNYYPKEWRLRMQEKSAGSLWYNIT